jgi:hypothetical protein
MMGNPDSPNAILTGANHSCDSVYFSSTGMFTTCSFCYPIPRRHRIAPEITIRLEGQVQPENRQAIA